MKYLNKETAADYVETEPTVYLLSYETSDWSGPYDETGGSVESFYYKPWKVFSTEEAALAEYEDSDINTDFTLTKINLY